jgi:hypothetical protein
MVSNKRTNGRRSRRYRLWLLCARLVPRMLVLLSALGIASGASAVGVDHEREQAIHRVDEIRQRLLHQDRQTEETGVRQLAQWYNFPNWPNWRNSWRNS